MTDAARNILDFLFLSNWLVFAYFLLVNSFYLLLLLTAIWEMREHKLAIRGEMRWRILGSRLALVVFSSVLDFSGLAIGVERLRSPQRVGHS
jgi:hypothetical protein